MEEPTIVGSKRPNDDNDATFHTERIILSFACSLPNGQTGKHTTNASIGAPQNQWPYFYAKCTGDTLTEQQKFVLANYL